MDLTQLSSVGSKMTSELTISYFLASFIFGVIGFATFRIGKKAGNFRVIAASIGLMVYPMFITNAWLVWGTGFALCFLIKLWWSL